MNEVRELGQELIEQGEVSHTHEVLPAICSRRSIRQFTNAPLSGEDVQMLLEAGLRAPSSRGAHTTVYTRRKPRNLDRAKLHAPRWS